MPVRIRQPVEKSLSRQYSLFWTGWQGPILENSFWEIQRVRTWARDGSERPALNVLISFLISSLSSCSPSSTAIEECAQMRCVNALLARQVMPCLTETSKQWQLSQTTYVTALKHALLFRRKWRRSRCQRWDGCLNCLPSAPSRLKPAALFWHDFTLETAD